MNKETAVTKDKLEEIEMMQLVIASTRQQLANAMATAAELDARLVAERHKTTVLLEQLAARDSDTVSTSTQR